MDRKIKAREAFMEGYNCCQSVVVAFCDDLNLSKQTLLNMASAFGAGYARTRNMCGAVTGIGMVVGLATNNTSENIKKEKDLMYAIVQNLTAEFISKNGSMICKDLLASLDNITTCPTSDERTAEYYKQRPCLRYVEDAVGIAEEYLIKKGLINE